MCCACGAFSLCVCLRGRLCVLEMELSRRDDGRAGRARVRDERESRRTIKHPRVPLGEIEHVAKRMRHSAFVGLACA